MIEKKVVATYNKTTDSPQMKGLWGFLRYEFKQSEDFLYDKFQEIRKALSVSFSGGIYDINAGSTDIC